MAKSDDVSAQLNNITGRMMEYEKSAKAAIDQYVRWVAVLKVISVGQILVQLVVIWQLYNIIMC